MPVIPAITSGASSGVTNMSIQRAKRGWLESPPPTRRLKPRVPSSAIAPESAMSLISPRAQSWRAPRDRDLVLAREVRVELVVEEVVVDRLGGGIAVDDLVMGEAGERAADDVARDVAARARRRHPDALEPLEKISGMFSSRIQWIWKHWRVVQSITPRPKSSAIEAIVSA